MQRPEQAVHEAIAAFLNVALPDHWEWQTVDNAARRSRVAQAALKSTGNKPGFPDIIILPPIMLLEERDGWAPLFIEVKASRGYPTQTQRARHRRLMDLGYSVCVARSPEDAERFLRDFGVPLRATCVTA